ncbi:hypothetical protein Dda_3738 [Drechslerella dactyloides]|uniref:Uncharacterized protein n=1 Tax=Drechslerella dactyloides TaxID=74499 RepID=A0AAD6IYH6_DREDA|nr:hypothetical protein Dda_3738 [Drechslerella dactyloides]
MATLAARSRCDMTRHYQHHHDVIVLTHDTPPRSIEATAFDGQSIVLTNELEAAPAPKLARQPRAAASGSDGGYLPRTLALKAAGPQQTSIDVATARNGGLHGDLPEPAG